MLSLLEVRGFRNLEPLHWPLPAGGQLILGPNGAGKTSLLEAIYLLATTRSFRTTRPVDCCRHGADRFDIEGEIDGRARLAVGWQRGGGRSRNVNGARSALADHLRVQPVLAWSAADNEILVGSPAHRRRMLDRGVIGLRPGIVEARSRYLQALHAKRQLLVARGPGCDHAELASWNRLLAETAAVLLRARATYRALLEVALAEILERCQLGLPPITLHYRPSPDIEPEPDAIERLLDTAVARETTQRRALIGPHRDRLDIRWGRHDLRRVASAGERKALGLALLAAQGQVLAAHDRRPIYLLDDADVELDRDRLGALWQAFVDADQVLATSNRPQVWEAIAIDRTWRCDRGRIL